LPADKKPEAKILKSLTREGPELSEGLKKNNEFLCALASHRSTFFPGTSVFLLFSSILPWDYPADLNEKHLTAGEIAKNRCSQRLWPHRLRAPRSPNDYR
jgi:hypothetical protein